jgi:hypothetical protein
LPCINVGIVEAQAGPVEQARHGKDVLNGATLEDPSGTDSAAQRLLTLRLTMNNDIDRPIADQPGIKLQLFGVVGHRAVNKQRIDQRMLLCVHCVPLGVTRRCVVGHNLPNAGFHPRIRSGAAFRVHAQSRLRVLPLHHLGKIAQLRVTMRAMQLSAL